MKKRILFAALLAFASTSLAGGIEYSPPYRPFNGIYTGFALGFDQNYYRFTLNRGVLDPNLVASLNNDVRLKGKINILRNAFVGNIFLGGGVQGEYVYFGGDFLLSFVTPTSVGLSAFDPSDNSSVNFRLKVRTTNIALDANPGLLIARNSLLYLVVGVVFSELKRSLVISPNVINLSSDPGITGLRAGIGIKQKISHNVALVLTYVFSYFEKKNLRGRGTFTIPETDETVSVRQLLQVRPNRYDITLGINWYFYT